MDDQITRQKIEIDVLGDRLRTKIKEVVQEKIKAQLHDMVKASIAEKVEEKVRNEVKCFERAQIAELSYLYRSSPFKYRKIYASKSSNTDGKSWK